MQRRIISNKLKEIVVRVAIVLLLSFVCRNVLMAEEPLLKSEYSYRRYTTADGLPSNINDCILQDGKGFIWIAGTSGFTSFDGFTFTNFMEGREANLYRLDRDENGRIRAFTLNLMYSFDKDSKLIETELSADKFLARTCAFALPDGYGLYANKDVDLPGGGKSMALYKTNNNRLEKILESPYLDYFRDTHTFFDVETQELYLLYDSDTVRIIADNKEPITCTGVVARAACKVGNTIFVVANDGIYRFADHKLIQVMPADFHFQVTPFKMVADGKGSLYFNCNNILYRFDGKTIEAVFQANIIKDFIVDNENNLWVITFQGLYNLFEIDFLTYKLLDETDVVRTTFYHPEKDAVIAGTLQGMIIEIGRNGIHEISYPPNPYGSAFFYDYSTVKDAVMYLPGPGDILKINESEKRWLNLPFFNTPWFVVPLPNGNLLEGGLDRLIEFSPQGDVVKDFGMDAMQQGTVAKPCFDSGGRLWFGGRFGISIYDYDAGRIVKTIFNDSVQRVRFMHNDAEDNVWFSSENRLYVSSGDTIKLEKTFPQLINGIYFTRQDNRMMILTQSGFYLFDKNRQESVFYNHENGYMGEESASGAIAEDSDGNIYLPSLAGLIRFNPRKITTASHKPKLQIISTLSSIDNIHWESMGDSISTLNYRYKNIRFNYIGLSYSQAQNVRYHYRLLGFQDKWSESTKNREVTFNNLPPGDYTFEMYADAGTNESRSETQSFSFSIRPAFWQTAWFLVACIMFLILASAGGALYVQRRKNKLLLEKLRAEKELNELRISSIRLKAIPHFNANVLAAIEYYITNRTKEEAMRILGIYSDFTYKTLREVDKAARSLGEELVYVKMYLDLEKIRFLDKFDFKIEIEEGVDITVELPNMILHTYCENAVKHGLMPLKSGGQLTIHVAQHDQIVSVSVEDNGVGRTYAAQKPQFHSSKQGLSILNRQIEIYNRFNREKINQQIEDLANGTRFTVEIPLAYTYIH